MEQLKPCPCCGGKSKLDSYPGSEWAQGGTYHCVRCDSCHLRTCDFKSAKKAIDAWNTRIDDPINAESLQVLLTDEVIRDFLKM